MTSSVCLCDAVSDADQQGGAREDLWGRGRGRGGAVTGWGGAENTTREPVLGRVYHADICSQKGHDWQLMATRWRPPGDWESDIWSVARVSLQVFCWLVAADISSGPEVVLMRAM